MLDLVCLSGGMDSATLLAVVKNNDLSARLQCVGFTYGSKHNSYENEAAAEVARYFGVPFELIDLSGVMSSFRSNLLKTGGEIPEGHYESQTMEQTVVPGRNLIFVTVCTGYGWSVAKEDEPIRLWLGIHSGDHAIYPDCRPDFYYGARVTVWRASGERVALEAPFLYEDKTKIIARGLELDVPYHLTRTCYKDQLVACGKCGSCQERLEAFANNGISDPVQYEARELLPK